MRILCSNYLFNSAVIDIKPLIFSSLNHFISHYLAHLINLQSYHLFQYKYQTHKNNLAFQKQLKRKLGNWLHWHAVQLIAI
jgi:hypothetical protein